MVNICHVYWFYPPAAIGGIETFLQSVSSKLVERGNEVTVITGSYGYKSGVENGVNVVRSEVMERYRKDMDKHEQESKAYALISRIVEDKKIDVLHVHNFHFVHNFAHTLAAIRVAKNAGIPIVLHVHGAGSDPVSAYLLSNIPWNKVACVSKYIATLAYDKGVDGKIIQAIYNGTNTERFKPGRKNSKLLEQIGIKKDMFIFGTPARLVTSSGEIVRRKGFFTIMKALSVLKERRDDFVWIVTGGKYPKKEIMENARKKIMDYARIYGIEHNVVIGVEIPEENMPDFYNSIDLMLMPSVNEPFGLSTVEAMACGRVAVGANSEATTEIIRNGIDGFLIEPNNHIQLADLLAKLMADDELRKKIGINARRSAVERFSINLLVDALEKMYEGLVDE